MYVYSMCMIIYVSRRITLIFIIIIHFKIVLIILLLSGLVFISFFPFANKAYNIFILIRFLTCVKCIAKGPLAIGSFDR